MFADQFIFKDMAKDEFWCYDYNLETEMKTEFTNA